MRGRSLRKRGLDGMRQIGFDSFMGLPPEAAKEGWEPGRYASTMGATRHYLKEHGVDLEQVTLVKGWFRDTLNERTRAQFGIEKASVIMLDCDIYVATKEALAFALPLVREQAVLIFDDWGWRSDLDRIGQREAYEECVIAPGLFTAEPLPGYIPQSRLFLITRHSACSSKVAEPAPGVSARATPDWDERFKVAGVELPDPSRNDC